MKVLTSEKNRVLNTKEYSLFTYPEYKLSQSKVSQLIEDIKIKNLNKDLPIMVDDEYNILDRRHVFVALRQLKLPIYYKVCEVAEAVDFLIAKKYNKKATPFDFCNFYKEKYSYRAVLSFAKNVPFPFMDVFKYIVGIRPNGRSRDWKAFERGEFEITKDLLMQFEFYKKLLEICESKGLYTNIHDDFQYFIPLSIDSQIESERAIDCLEKLLDKYEHIVDWHKDKNNGIISGLDFFYQLYQMHFNQTLICRDTLADSIINPLMSLKKYDLILSLIDKSEIEELRRVWGKYGVAHINKHYLNIVLKYDQLEKEIKLLNHL